MNEGERRTDTRYGIAYPMEKEETHENKAMAVVNVSKGGVAFVAPKPVDKDAKFNLHIFLKKKMYKLCAAAIYSMAREDGYYDIGAKFLDLSEEFVRSLEQDIEDIKQFHQECTRHYDKDISFRKASTAYLNNVSPREI